MENKSFYQIKHICIYLCYNTNKNWYSSPKLNIVNQNNRKLNEKVPKRIGRSYVEYIDTTVAAHLVDIPLFHESKGHARTVSISNIGL
jgi:hypothetical protein